MNQFSYVRLVSANGDTMSFWCSTEIAEAARSEWSDARQALDGSVDDKKIITIHGLGDDFSRSPSTVAFDPHHIAMFCVTEVKM